ncbi:MAG: hypothetical protein AB9835_10970 [Eubacteriales bacterium]
MIKGVSKKVIVIRDPQSELFEEAYFIIKTGKGLSRPSEDDMVSEANRLISAYCASGGEDRGAADGALRIPVRLAQSQSARQSLPGRSYQPQYARSKSSLGLLRALIYFAAGMAFTGMVFVILRFVVFVI